MARPQPILCAGLGSAHKNDVCERRDSCQRYANWWEAPNVQFNACSTAGKPFKLFLAIDTKLPQPRADLRAPGINQMDLFA